MQFFVNCDNFIMQNHNNKSKLIAQKYKCKMFIFYINEITIILLIKYN